MKLTELANELLTRTGNMDIYQESFEQIKKKVKLYNIYVYYVAYIIIFVVKNYILQIEQADKHAHPSKQEAELDMYADDFDEREKAKLDDADSGV